MLTTKMKYMICFSRVQIVLKFIEPRLELNCE